MVRQPVDILVVEDNPADRLLIREYFLTRNPTCRLRFAGDGAEALAQLLGKGKYEEQKAPDLILLDLNLPKVDGHEVLNLIKTHPTLRRIPVIVLSSSASELDIRTSFDHYANCYLVKPSELDEYQELMARIEEFWLGTTELLSQQA